MIATNRCALVLALLPMLLAAGCVSASRRYEQGIRLEERGQPAEAARRYIDALRRDPSLGEARSRLRETGLLAVERSLADSDAQARVGSHGDAAETLLQLDALRRDAAGVGVEIAVPADYPAVRSERLGRAVDWSLDEAVRLGRAARYGDALGRLDRAASRWSPSAEQERRMEELRLETFVAWSEHEARAGRYRVAYDVAERGLAAVGTHPDLGRLRDAQLRALEAGTVAVALLPVQVEDRIARELGASFVRDLEGELELGAWTRPPRFVEVVDPREVRIEARRLRNPDLRSVVEAARLGRAVDADLAVIVEIDSTAFGTADERTERRTARTRSGADTAYTVVAGRVEGSVRVRYTLVDVPARRRVGEESVTVRASRPFRQARYAGDWRQLLLSRDDQRLFDAGAMQAAERETRSELLRQLATAIPRSAFDRVLREIR
jgi:hypothetical protein